MASTPPSPREEPELEGDYRPADSETPGAHLDPANIRVEPADAAYLMRLTDALNTTLDLETLLRRTSELVAAVIPYSIFAILLVNDRTHELRVRFQIGHTTRVERLHIPMTRGVVGQGHGSERADFTLAGLRPSPDSGNTASMSYVWQRPKTRRLENIETDYAGFSIPNVFVIGYGMDYAERNRNLPGL